MNHLPRLYAARRVVPLLLRSRRMTVPLLFVAALLVGYFRPVVILVLFPILLLYGGVWALGPLLVAVIGLASNRADGGSVSRRQPIESEYKAGYQD